MVCKITLQISWLACPYRCCYLEWTLGLNLSQLQQKLQWAAPALWCWALSNLGQKNRTSWSFWCITKPFWFSFSCSWGIVFFLQRFITDAVIMHQKPYCMLFFLEMISEKLLSLLCQVEYIYIWIIHRNSSTLIATWKAANFPPECLHSKNSAFLLSPVIMRLGNIWLWSSGFQYKSLAVQSHVTGSMVWSLYNFQAELWCRKGRRLLFSPPRREISVNLSTWDPAWLSPFGGKIGSNSLIGFCGLVTTSQDSISWIHRDLLCSGSWVGDRHILLPSCFWCL